MHKQFQEAFKANQFLNQPISAEKELTQYQVKVPSITIPEVSKIVVMTYRDPRLDVKMSITERYRIMHVVLARLTKGTKDYKKLYGDIQVLKQAYTAYGEKLRVIVP